MGQRADKQICKCDVNTEQERITEHSPSMGIALQQCIGILHPHAAVVMEKRATLEGLDSCSDFPVIKPEIKHSAQAVKMIRHTFGEEPLQRGGGGGS